MVFRDLLAWCSSCYRCQRLICIEPVRVLFTHLFWPHVNWCDLHVSKPLTLTDRSWPLCFHPADWFQDSISYLMRGGRVQARFFVHILRGFRKRRVRYYAYLLRSRLVSLGHICHARHTAVSSLFSSHWDLVRSLCILCPAAVTSKLESPLSQLVWQAR